MEDQLGAQFNPQYQPSDQPTGHRLLWLVLGAAVVIMIVVVSVVLFWGGGSTKPKTAAKPAPLTQTKLGVFAQGIDTTAVDAALQQVDSAGTQVNQAISDQPGDLSE